MGGEGDNRGWDGWMASLTQWTWVWVSSRSWWWTGRSGMLQSRGSQGVRYDWVTELSDWFLYNFIYFSKVVVICPILFLILVIWVFFLPWSLSLKLCYFLTFLNNQTFICWVYLWLFYSLFPLLCSNIYCWLCLPIWVQFTTFPNLGVMCFFFLSPQNNSIQCAYNRWQSSSSWSVLWRPRRPPSTTTKTRCSIHQLGWVCQSRKSKDAWSNRQVLPWRTEWIRAQAN